MSIDCVPIIETQIDIIFLNKSKNIIIFNSPPILGKDESGVDFHEVLERIKEQTTLRFGDIVLYLSSNAIYYLITITSAFALEYVECLNTHQKSKVLKMIKKKLN